MIDYDTAIKRAHKRNQDFFGLRGDEVLLVPANERVNRTVWNLSKETRTSSVIPARYQKQSLKKMLLEPSISSKKDKIVIISRKSTPTIFANNFRIFSLLTNSVKEEYYKDTTLFRKFLEDLDLIYSIPSEKLVIWLYLPIKDLKHIGRKIIPLIKRLDREEYARYSDLSCAICNREIDINRSHSHFYEQYERYVFNLPICTHHKNIDIFKVANELRKNTFSIPQFITNVDKYIKQEEETCIMCKRIMPRYSSSPICKKCLRHPSNYYINIALNLIDIRDPPRKFVRNLRCPDCNTPLEHEGLCPDCEARYDWDLISRDLDNNELEWDQFMSDRELREGYLW